jgi:hypothetical protein
MGLLSLFSKPEPSMVHLPSGSFTVDRTGRTLVSTLPSSFPESLMNEISTQVRTAFLEAKAAQLSLTELVIHYPSLKIIARELRGGALIFLVPINLASTTGQYSHL